MTTLHHNPAKCINSTHNQHTHPHSPTNRVLTRAAPYPRPRHNLQQGRDPRHSFLEFWSYPGTQSDTHSLPHSSSRTQSARGGRSAMIPTTEAGDTQIHQARSILPVCCSTAQSLCAGFWFHRMLIAIALRCLAGLAGLGAGMAKEGREDLECGRCVERLLGWVVYLCLMENGAFSGFVKGSLCLVVHGRRAFTRKDG